MAQTIRELIHENGESMTRSDQKIARAVLADYPTAALKTVADLAEISGVSDPSVIRFVKRLGFAGYPQFQQNVQKEIAESLTSAASGNQIEPNTQHLPPYASDYLSQLKRNLTRTLDALQSSEVEGASQLLADQSRRALLISDSENEPNLMAFQRGLFSVRSNCVRLESDPLMRSNAIMGIKKNEVVVAFLRDPYDVSSLTFCRMAVERGAQLILFSDQVQMPLSGIARYMFCADGVKDSSIPIMCLAEVVLIGTKQLTGGSSTIALPTMDYADSLDPNFKPAT